MYIFIPIDNLDPCPMETGKYNVCVKLDGSPLDGEIKLELCPD